MTGYFIERYCEACRKTMGTYSYRYIKDRIWTRGYFHPDCFKKHLEKLDE